MSAESCYIACDLGAESGRVILGRVTPGPDGRVSLEEIHRFPNGAIRIENTLRWDVLRIWDEIKEGLRKIAARGLAVHSVSVDSWGLDYVLHGAGQPMLSLPYSYRDARTDAPFAEIQREPVRSEIFAQTGIQFMPINTLCQLIAERRENPRLLELADGFLLIADYLHYLCSGVAAAEESLASTTQLYDPVKRCWATALAARFELPERLFPRLVPPGTRLGPLRPDVAAEVGLGDLEVVATCSHDTGAAVAAVPAAEGDDWAYLSSGTWSLLGVELPAPLLTPEALAHNFTNEAGFAGTTRLLKNIVGLWLLQECRRTWAREGRTFSYAELATAAEAAPAFRSIIDPSDARFLKPDAMPARIADFCRETGQPVPSTPGEFTRCIYESLALLYRRCLEQIETVTGRRIRRLHIVGGGSQSDLLNRFAASATGRQIIAGPVEATAFGNVLIQAIAHGRISTLAEARQIVARSVPLARFEPEENDAWNRAFERFRQLAH